VTNAYTIDGDATKDRKKGVYRPHPSPFAAIIDANEDSESGGGTEVEA